MRRRRRRASTGCTGACGRGGGRTGDQSASGRNGSPAESDRLQTLPIPADHRHRGIRIRLTLRVAARSRPLRLIAGDSNSSFNPDWTTCLGCRGRLATGDGVVGIPQFHPESLHPIGVTVKHCLTTYVERRPTFAVMSGCGLSMPSSRTPQCASRPARLSGPCVTVRSVGVLRRLCAVTAA